MKELYSWQVIKALTNEWANQHLLPWRSKKAEIFEKLLGFARSDSIVTRGSLSLSCATTPHLSRFSKSARYKKISSTFFIFEKSSKYFNWVKYVK